MVTLYPPIDNVVICFSSRGCHYLHKDKGWCEIDDNVMCGIYQTELGVCIILQNK
jgi:hypothetical protein